MAANGKIAPNVYSWRGDLETIKSLGGNGKPLKVTQ